MNNPENQPAETPCRKVVLTFEEKTKGGNDLNISMEFFPSIKKDEQHDVATRAACAVMKFLVKNGTAEAVEVEGS